MCRMQKIYLGQLLVLLGIPLEVLFMFLLGGLTGAVLLLVLLFCSGMAVVILEVLARHAAIQNERDRHIQAGANTHALGFYFVATGLGASIASYALSGETVTIPEHLDDLTFWGGFWLLGCARNTAWLILYRRGGSLAVPGSSPNSERPASFEAR